MSSSGIIKEFTIICAPVELSARLEKEIDKAQNDVFNHRSSTTQPFTKKFIILYLAGGIV